MRNTSEIQFSLIIPSKNRIGWLTDCILSFFSKASTPEDVEAIVLLDIEDLSYCEEVQKVCLESGYNICLVIKKNGIYDFNRHYMNHGAQCSHGHYMWVLNDECEMETEGWDDIIHREVGPRRNYPLYIMTADGTHSLQSGMMEQRGTCFPMVTVAFVEAINGVLFPEVVMEGSDIAMYRFWNHHFPDMLIDLSKKISVLHRRGTYWDGAIDETSKTRDKIRNSTNGPVLTKPSCSCDEHYRRLVQDTIQKAEDLGAKVKVEDLGTAMLGTAMLGTAMQKAAPLLPTCSLGKNPENPEDRLRGILESEAIRKSAAAAAAAAGRPSRAASGQCGPPQAKPDMNSLVNFLSRNLNVRFKE
jgi:hypothetical protein